MEVKLKAEEMELKRKEFESRKQEQNEKEEQMMQMQQKQLQLLLKQQEQQSAMMMALMEKFLNKITGCKLWLLVNLPPLSYHCFHRSSTSFVMFDFQWLYSHA